MHDYANVGLYEQGQTSNILSKIFVKGWLFSNTKIQIACVLQSQYCNRFKILHYKYKNNFYLPMQRDTFTLASWVGILFVCKFEELNIL